MAKRTTKKKPTAKKKRTTKKKATRKRLTDLKLRDLKAAPYNPREIDGEARAALTASMGEFGDISGITWNQRTGFLVAGHQRLRSLQEEYGKQLRMARGKLVTPDGTFAVRIVDWSPEKERAANLVANSPLLAGVFTTDAASLFDELAVDDPLAQALRLPALQDLLGEPEDDGLADAFGKLPEGDRKGFQQMCFVLSDGQAEAVRAALKRSKAAGDFTDTGNTNSNGNALARIVEAFG